jgi:hypothetical protein
MSSIGVLLSDFVVLYCMVDDQLFLQPRLVPLVTMVNRGVMSMAAKIIVYDSVSHSTADDFTPH